jgi:class 3 adenylate cyclase
VPLTQLKNLLSHYSRFFGQMSLLFLLTILVGVVTSQFIENDVEIFWISVSAGVLLTVWWCIVAWIDRAGLMVDMQAYFLENQILPYRYERIKNHLPWMLGENQKKILRTAAGEYQNLQLKAKEAQQTMEKYVGSNVTNKAVAKAARNELGGELRRVYVLFSDIRGFTHMTEMLKPEETVDILNKMFTAMEEVITQNEGDINKYIGDAIFAYFRRPYGNEGEASKLVLRTALRMQDRFELLNKTFKIAYSQPVEIGLGVGITAGTAIMGNMGSGNRMEFTLIGDTVNLASRLCGIAKHGQILVNEEMADVSHDYFELMALPAVQIKGKSGLVTPYLVTGERLTMSR